MDPTTDAKHEAAVYSSHRRTLRSLSSGGNRIDGCLSCWLGDLGRSLNGTTLIWSSQAV